MIRIIEENYTDKSKKSRTGHARMIFNNAWNIEALEVIKASKVPEKTRNLAETILNSEIGLINSTTNILKDKKTDANNIFPDEVMDKIYCECSVKTVLVNSYERNVKARLE